MNDGLSASDPALPYLTNERRSLRQILAGRAGLVPSLCLLVPLAFLGFFFITPVLTLISVSVAGPDGFTFEHYERFFSDPFYVRVLIATVRIAAITTLCAALLGFPLALVICNARQPFASILLVVVLAPLLVNIVVRAYGWRIMLGRSGILNWALMQLGITTEPLSILYNEFSVILGSLHVFLPLMVMPIVASLEKIDPALVESAAILGARPSRTLWHVILPLALPGLAAGSTLVFSLTASSFVMPALLGGDLAKMLATLAEEQILSVFDWPMGATIATVLVAVVLTVVMTFMILVEARYKTQGPSR